ncbi:MAG TPA: GNAT family N-acetyltransferase [Acidimicrobiales bacterium]|nr:GNAT family N-acetyltransferase [Acidimicrobiales bacterium]
MARHELSIAGRRFALRPLGVADAELVVELRTDPGLSRYNNPTSPAVSDLVSWTVAYFDRDDDYSFVVDDRLTATGQGTISLYHLEPSSGEVEMGRFVLRPGSLAAPECVLLAYRLAFERLGARRIYCRTWRENDHVVSFHSSCGLREVGPALPVEVHGTCHEAVEQEVTAETWPAVEARLERAAAAAALLLER